jgi:hypothetical protein
MQVFKRGTRQFQLPCGFKADGAIGAGHGDNLAVFVYGFPAKFGHGHQQIANTAWLVIRRLGMIRPVIDEFFMFGANAPAVLRLFALGNRGDELIARFNDGIVAVRNSFCAHARGLEM